MKYSLLDMILIRFNVLTPIQIPGNLTSYTIGCSEVISNYLDCYQKLIAFLLSLLAVVQFMLVLLSCKAKTIYKKQMTELSFKSELVLQESPLHHI